MRKLFVYYSYSGNGDEVATCLKEKEYEIQKVKTSKPLPKNYALGIIVGGFKAGIHYQDPLVDFYSDVTLYDEIVIGSPIWNARFSSPINTVLEKLNLTNKNLTFVLYSGSGKSPKATQKIHENYPNAKIIDLQEPKKNKEELKKLEEL